jgi:uroporphyrin-3 C-methyltransferase
VAEAAAANGVAAEPSPEVGVEKLTLDSALAGLREFAGLAWAEIRSMIRIQRFDRAEPALLAPGQEFFLRENLKLRLLSARLALFSRDQWTYRNELSTAKHWLENYFLDDAPAVSAAASQLDELLASEIVIDLPDLRASQQALLGLRDGRSAR